MYIYVLIYYGKESCYLRLPLRRPLVGYGLLLPSGACQDDGSSDKTCVIEHAKYIYTPAILTSLSLSPPSLDQIVNRQWKYDEISDLLEAQIAILPGELNMTAALHQQGASSKGTM